MSKIFYLLLIIIFFFSTGCSFDNKSGIWKDRAKELKVKKLDENVKFVFSKVEKFRKEISTDSPISLQPPVNNFEWLEENFDSSNFVPHLEYENKKNLIYKSKKILKKTNSSFSDFEPLILNKNIFFYDNQGTIFNFSLDSKTIVWDFNFYKKKFKKFPIKINFQINSDNLIAADNLGYFYSIDINSGKIRWAKNYGVPFRSNIKVSKKYTFSVNQDNKFYGINNIDGEKRLDLETFPSFLQSQQKTSVSIDKDNQNVFFITSAGEIYSINYSTNIINWMYKTTSRSVDKTVDLFFSSPLIHYRDQIVVSTSVSTISLNSLTGLINWEIPISTYIRPAISNNFIFLATYDGFIINVNILNGKVIWSKNIFNKSKKINEDKIGKITSIILLSDEIFLTTKKGYFLFLNFKNGKIINYAKADKSGFFSKPIIADKKIYLINMKGQVIVFN